MDAHFHEDLNLLVCTNNKANLMQGVTTMIAGNFGFAPSPIKDVWEFTCWEYRSTYFADPSYFNMYKFHYVLEAGAQGMSTGLDYVPRSFTTTEEIIELTKIVKEYDGMYATHFRYRDRIT